MTDFKSCTKAQLVAVCRDRKWRGYSRFNKPQLLNYARTRDVRERSAASVIQQHTRRFLRNLAGTCQVVNSTDVFTMEPFGQSEGRFRVRSGTKIYRFNHSTLLEYMVSTGKFQNPFTRQPLAASDLTRLRNYVFRPGNIRILKSIQLGDAILTPNTNMTEFKHEIRRRRLDQREHVSALQYVMEQTAVIFEHIHGLAISVPEDMDTAHQVMTAFIHVLVPTLREQLRHLASLNSQLTHSLIVKYLHKMQLNWLRTDGIRQFIIGKLFSNLHHIHEDVLGYNCNFPLVV